MTASDRALLQTLCPGGLDALRAARIYLRARRRLLDVEERHLRTGRLVTAYSRAQQLETEAARQLEEALRLLTLPDDL